MPVHLIRRAALCVAAAALAGGAVACSSSTTPSDRPGTSSTAVPAEHGAFAHCLTEHGVPAPPNGGPAGPQPVNGPPPGVDQDTWDKAMQACSSLAPGPPGP